ncbi:hypothetical protein H4J45_18550 [Colwellia sp. BRX10-6]|uniref:hypothetical protein n=1 Tax=unclassified Colwellia TaxID=196834 RepID=UPI0015F52E42|nr:MULTISPECIES: hypothetical protein [unclassified Colwellia]MBA6385223.1 hypothetical protein [Colwellia sp. BRX10-9]MBA6396078.1 hypothetical protein [Colwellia sp. BRX10-6]
MKSLSSFCILLWLIPYFGKQYFPEIFGVWYIQWTSFGLLSLILPYGFARSILVKNDHKFASGFLFIFLLNVFLNSIGLNLLNTTNTFLTVNQKTELIAENTSLEAINNENPEVRKVIAQVIYKEFGQPIMYKDQLGDFVVYKPTDEDKILFSERFITGSTAKELIKNTTLQIKEVMYSFGWTCSCFLIIFIVVFRWEQCKANNTP